MSAATQLATLMQDQKFRELGLTKTIVNDEDVCTYSRGLASVSEKNPVLVLLHGYPQSSYLWRHFIPLLPPGIPLFVPDLPGYGASAPIEKNDKLSVGNALLSALQTLIKRSSPKAAPAQIPVILAGHDRGARVAHRLAVSGYEGVDIKGVCLIDIVPTLTQWRACSNPAEVSAYFHWPFLANEPQATAMITAYGGARWCQDMLRRWSGSNARGQQSFQADGAFDVYGGFFGQESVVRASNADYAAGATADVQAQVGDQGAGRKIRVPVLVMYSEGYLGRRYDVPGEWRDWVDGAAAVKVWPVGEDVGHFVPEEAPEVSVRGVREWLGELGVYGD